MTAAGFLALSIAIAVGLLGTLATVAIAGPVNPPTTNPPAERRAAVRPVITNEPAEPGEGCGDCAAVAGRCRWHRGFAAGWDAHRHAGIAGGLTGPQEAGPGIAGGLAGGLASGHASPMAKAAQGAASLADPRDPDGTQLQVPLNGEPAGREMAR